MALLLPFPLIASHSAAEPACQVQHLNSQGTPTDSTCGLSPRHHPFAPAHGLSDSHATKDNTVVNLQPMGPLCTSDWHAEAHNQLQILKGLPV